MSKLSRNLLGWIATIIIIFAVSTPITSSLTGILFISQNINSLITVLLGILCGLIISYYAPIIKYYFTCILYLLTR